MANVRLEEVPESDRQYELVGGVKVWLPLRSVYAHCLAKVLWQELCSYLDGRDLGRAYLHMMYDLGLPGEVCRRPSVSCLSYQRWPKGRRFCPTAEALDAIPELVAEVLGPDDLSEGTLERVENYFAAGVCQVWLFYPMRKVVHLFNSFTSVRAATVGDTLDAGAVLPGFRLRLEPLLHNPPRRQDER
jgi:hypothetical protein